ncbi:MAG: hypothetical protein AAB676_09110 [Verrucomicrobiota bacterium]
MKTELYHLIATTPERRPSPARRFPLALLVLGALLWGAPAGLWAQPNSPEEYTFLTLAGPAESGPGAIDGAGRAARFNSPKGVAVDGTGNVYVADTSNGTIRKIDPTGMVTTLAGLAGQSGSANGTGSAARFREPADIAVDGAGNLYVADAYNHLIRKISPTAEVTTLAGNASVTDEWGSPAGGYVNGMGSAARFNGPTGIAVDSAGNVYVADAWNSAIRRISPAGVVTTLAGLAGQRGSANGTGSSARFREPADIAVDGDGNLYVADTYNHLIRKISPTAEVTTLAGNASVTNQWGSPEGAFADGMGAAARFNSPSGITVDRAGNVYVADAGNQTIRQISPAGAVTTLAGQAGAGGDTDGTGHNARFGNFRGGPQGVAVDTAGNVYVADTSNCAIRRISPAGEVTTLAGQAGGNDSADGAGSAARFGLASGVAVDPVGNLYVADHAANTIRKIGPGGVVTTLAGLPGEGGSADGTGSAARFCGPAGMTVDNIGNVYVADSCNSTIRKISPAGEVTTLAGQAGESGSTDGPGSAARFSGPEGVAVDVTGNVYVGDTGNHTIRKISPAGVVTTLAGLALDTNGDGDPDGGYADGTGSAARFNWPYGVAVDSVGNLYVSDGRNSAIRKISPAGVVTTVAGMVGQIESADGTGSEAHFKLVLRSWWDCVWAGIAVDNSGTLYVADGGGWGDWVTFTASTIRVGFKACADRPVVDLALAPVGVTRQLDTAPQSATAWQWSWVRRPAASRAELSSTTVRNPTFTPDAPDLYVLRLLATNQVTGEVSLRTLELAAVPAAVAVLASPERLFDGSFQLNLIGQTNQAYTIQVSTDLSAWTDWTNATPTSSNATLTDPEAALHPQRFYRAVKQ